MTSFAFILGVVPLAIASGASANSRHSIGTGVIGGMIGATMIAVFFIPMFYVLLSRFSERFSKKKGGSGMKPPFLASLVALLVAGCAVGPDYVQPDVTKPEGWRSGTTLPAAEQPESLANLAWWTLIEDPVLDALVTEALASNRGLTPRPATVDRQNNQYSAALNVGWEIDLFGRLRRASEAGQADLLASEEALRIFELRYRGGVISAMELAQVQAEVETARIAVPTVEQAIALQENALSSLLGRLPGPIKCGKTLSEMGLPLPPVSLPANVLERRPDIRQAEQNLIAYNARIGVARAAYFPNVTLTGLLGSSSISFSNLFSGPARIWSYGADLSLPIFTAGAIAGQVQSAEARQVQALEQYRKSIENAFREVDDALISGTKSREVVDGRIRQVEALKTYAHNARLRYDAGYSAYLEVLDAERSLFLSQIYESQARAQALIAVTTLYKVLGGGWAATTPISATE